MKSGKSFCILTTPLILFITLSCNSDSNEKHFQHSEYDNLIFNAALSYPYYNYNIYQFGGSRKESERRKKNILQKIKSIKDDSTSLELILHTWTDSTGDIPKNIISISVADRFRFAFPFYDEYFYSRAASTTDSLLQRDLLRHANLSVQLNHILYETHWNTTKNIAKADHLITLVADSLLGLTEYVASDTAGFKKALLKDLQGANLGESCAKSLKKNISWLAKEAVLKNVRIFNTVNGRHGFWKFTILMELHGYISIVATIHNLECYEINPLENTIH